MNHENIILNLFLGSRVIKQYKVNIFVAIKFHVFDNLTKTIKFQILIKL